VRMERFQQHITITFISDIPISEDESLCSITGIFLSTHEMFYVFTLLIQQ
jgi:hypothetical protein